ncbi:hypothetical protein MTP99_002051 [Tenebrio molitor]|jgi:hypothetical protein|nr:hypothetical protein MTP99_002051 [Tenebrio molitor]
MNIYQVVGTDNICACLETITWGLYPRHAFMMDASEFEQGRGTDVELTDVGVDDLLRSNFSPWTRRVHVGIVMETHTTGCKESFFIVTFIECDLHLCRLSRGNAQR